MKLVSVIIPVYNAERYLVECIESVLNQSYQNIEIILVDDCSKDNSYEIIKKYEAADKRVIALQNSRNSHVSVTRENGFVHSHGEWICFIDNDDVLHPEAIKILMDEVQNGVDMVIGESKVFSKNIQWDNKSVSNSRVLNREQIVENMGGYTLNTGSMLWGKIISRRVLNEVNPAKYKKDIPITYFEDAVIVPQLYAAAEKVVCVDQCLYGYRFVKDSISRKPCLKTLNYELQKLVGLDLASCLFKDNRAYDYFVEFILLQAIKVDYLIQKNKIDEQKAKCIIKKYIKIYLSRNRVNFVNYIIIHIYVRKPRLCYWLVLQPYYNFAANLLRQVQAWKTK